MLGHGGVLCLEKDPQSTPLTRSPLERKHCRLEDTLGSAEYKHDFLLRANVLMPQNVPRRPTKARTAA